MSTMSPSTLAAGAASAPVAPAEDANAPIRVAYVTHTAARGGCMTSLRHLVRALPRDRVRPVVIAPPGPSLEDLEADGIETIVLPGISMLVHHVGAPLRGVRWLTLLRTIADLRHGPLLRRVLERVAPDLVHINELGMFQAAAIARRMGLPVVTHVRGVAPHERTIASRVVDRCVARYVDTLIAIDQSVARSYAGHEPVVVYNPLSPRFVDSEPALPAPEPGITRFTYLTGLVEYKGIRELLEAARRLRHRTDIRFRIAGANPRPDDFYRTPAGRLTHWLGISRDVLRSVREFIRDESLGATVELLGHVDPYEILRSGTDVLVFPSRLDGPGRSVYEAGSLGIPSIVALKHRVEDVVVHRVNGIIVPERDPAALADAILELADDASLRERLGRAAREQFRKQFSPDAAVAGVLQVYEQVLAHRRSGTRAGPE